MSSSSLEYHINALKDVRVGLDENIQKVSRQVQIDQIRLESVSVPCAAISAFIKSTREQLEDAESLEERAEIARSALQKLESYSVEYVSNERHILSKRIGMVEGFQVYAQSIDEHIVEKQTEIEAHNRVQERVENGENLNRRKAGTRPEKLKDIRHFEERTSE